MTQKYIIQNCGHFIVNENKTIHQKKGFKGKNRKGFITNFKVYSYLKANNLLKQLRKYPEICNSGSIKELHRIIKDKDIDRSTSALNITARETGGTEINAGERESVGGSQIDAGERESVGGSEIDAGEIQP